MGGLSRLNCDPEGGQYGCNMLKFTNICRLDTVDGIVQDLSRDRGGEWGELGRKGVIWTGKEVCRSLFMTDFA